MFKKAMQGTKPLLFLLPNTCLQNGNCDWLDIFAVEHMYAMHSSVLNSYCGIGMIHFPYSFKTNREQKNKN